MATRQTNVNINYTVNTADIERGNGLLARASKSTDELRKATDTFSKQAGTAYRFTSRTIEGMGIEVARLKQQVKLASLQNTQDVAKLSAQYRSAKSQLDAYNKSLLETSRASKQTTVSAQGMATQFNNVYNAIRAIIAAGLARELINTTLEMAKLSGTVEGVTAAFNRLPNATLLLHNLREATHGAVTDLDLMQKAIRANNFRIPLEKMGTLLEFAAVKAQQTGQEVNHLVEYIVSGIGYRSIKRLDDLGFTLNRVNKALGGVSLQAASVSQVMDALTKLMQEDLEETGGYAETAATKVGQITTAWHELRVAISQKLENTSILHFFETTIKGMKDLVEAFPTDKLKEVFTGANPIAWIGQMSDVIAFWHLGLQDVAEANAINKNATEEAARVEKKLADFTLQQRIPLLDAEIKKKQEVADEYFYQIQAMDMTVDKYSEENIARKLNLREIEATIKILKELKKAQEDALNAPPDGDGKAVPRGRPKPLRQVVDLRFRNPDTGLISKESNKKILEDFGAMALTVIGNLPPAQVPIVPFIPWDKWERALEENKFQIMDVSANIIQDQIDSIMFAEVDAYNARIDRLREFYDEQIAMAGDNERAKSELRIKEEREVKKLEMERADREKKAAKAGILVNTALGIMKAFATSTNIYEGIIHAALVGAQGASQLIIADRARYYAKGVIDLDGPGTETSDSINARLSRGESVMTAKETRESRGVLKAIRAKRLNDKVMRDIVSGRSGGASVAFDDSRLLSKLDEVKNAQPDILIRANMAYEVRKRGDSYKRIIRSKSVRS